MPKLLRNLAATLLLTAIQSFAQSERDFGPDGGRMVDFSANRTVQGEVTLTNGTFHVALLDKNMKRIPLEEQTLTVIGGDRNNPERPNVQKRGDYFAFPALKGDSYLLVFQFKENPSAKPVTARLEYDSAICSGCKKGEWLCDCHVKASEKKEI
jgi:hypothetical protein